MAYENNRQRVERFIDAFLSGDSAAQQSLVHPDVVFHSPESLPYGGQWHGHDGWRAMKKAIAEVWSELKLTITRVIGADHDECFAVIATLQVTARATGARYEAEVMEQWHWQDGLLVYVRPYYWDTARVLEVTGLSPNTR